MRMRRSIVLIALASSLAAQAAKPLPRTAPPAPAAPVTSASGFTVPPRTAGSKDAPITIEVWTDFECPTCKMLYMNTLKPLIPDYCTPGKVYLIHHDFPLPQHKYSLLAAVWADAAAVVGKYEVVAEALFDKQDSWVATGGVSSVVAGVLSPADFQKVKQVYDAHQTEIKAIIEEDKKAGTALDLKETPTMRVSKRGQIITDKQPGMVAYVTLKRYLDQQLAK